MAASKEKAKGAKNSKATESPALAKLNKRQRKYVKGVIEGKSKRKAALDAGYSESSANRATVAIEHADVQRAFRELIQKTIAKEKIAQRLAEGLDAMETKFASFEGVISDQRDVIAWGERRAYLELIAKYGGFYIDKQQIDMTNGTDNSPERLAAILARAVKRADEVHDAKGTSGS